MSDTLHCPLSLSIPDAQKSLTTFRSKDHVLQPIIFRSNIYGLWNLEAMSSLSLTITFPFPFSDQLAVLMKQLEQHNHQSAVQSPLQKIAKSQLLALRTRADEVLKKLWWNLPHWFGGCYKGLLYTADILRIIQEVTCFRYQEHIFSKVNSKDFSLEKFVFLRRWYVNINIRIQSEIMFLFMLRL